MKKVKKVFATQLILLQTLPCLSTIKILNDNLSFESRFYGHEFLYHARTEQSFISFEV